MRASAFLLLLMTFGISTGCSTDPAKPLRASSLVDTEAVAEAGRIVPQGKVTSAGQPDEAALEVLAESGYRAVIDLRGPDEDRGYDERKTVESLGMNYVAFPVTGTGDIDFQKAARLDALIEAQDGPVLVHCGSGNRVGAMLALIDSLEGASDEEALATGREYGLTRLEETVRERLQAD